MGKTVEKVKKICPNCKKIFLLCPSEEKKYTYCSTACRTAAKQIKYICKNCGKEFTAPSCRKNVQCCSPECSYSYKAVKVTRICKYCGKEFSVNKSSQNLCCSDSCQTAWRAKIGMTKTLCAGCGKEITVPNRRVERNENCYCSSECAAEHSKTGTWDKCSYCGEPVWRMKSNSYHDIFCDKSCAEKFRFEFKRIVEKKCEMCGKKYYVKNSHSKTSKFCSRACLSMWQSKNWVGENNPHYTSEIVPCAYCGKFVKRIQSDKYNKINKFCCHECATSFYLIPEHRTDKQKQADIKLATEAINYIKPTLTRPHIVINNMLEDMCVAYENEYNIEYYLLDIYLPKYSLGIEVNGDFWHANPVKYKEINYIQQKNSIRRDKSKHIYVKNHYGYEILYLWEKDIVSRLSLCKALICEYIKSGGKLSNYHSFNYYLDDDDNLILRKDILIAYADIENKDIPFGEKLLENKKAS